MRKLTTSTVYPLDHLSKPFMAKLAKNPTCTHPLGSQNLGTSGSVFHKPGYRFYSFLKTACLHVSFREIY